ncbi:Hsp20/alpha crystallin family protein [Candidatus Woesearchaeota archaeon]|nr:Hsp20/alpha crystallin family protein [Candidatus Woesearchaeota archaeon]
MTFRSMWDEMRRMQENMDRLFGELTGTGVGSDQPLLSGPEGQLPATREAVTDVYETDKEVVAEFELPGLDKKDIDVQVHDDCIEVSGQKEEKKEDKQHQEHRSVSFYRRLPLPANADPENVTAEFENGVLKVRMAKSEKQAEGRKVDVK